MARRVAYSPSLVYNVLDFGAKGDGTTNDRAAIQAAIDLCPEFGTVYFPSVATGYLLSGAGTELLLVTKNIHLLGEHPSGVNGVGGSDLLIAASVGATTDVIRIAAASRHNFQRVEGLGIKPVSGIPARHALVLDITAANTWAWRMQVRFNWFGVLGGRSFTLTNPVNSDGFFCSTISDNVFECGMSLLRCGDSVDILRNTFWGFGGAFGGEQTTFAGIDLTLVPGAARIIMRQNNCTLPGGFLRATNCLQLTIEDNQIEQTFATTMAESAQIALLGSSTNACRIVGNNFNGHNNVTRNILVGAGTDAWVANNKAIAATNGIEIGASADRTTLCANYGIGGSATVTNLGANTRSVAFV